jgi:hypothetical protein
MGLHSLVTVATLAAFVAAGGATVIPGPGVVLLDNDAVVASDYLNDHCTTIVAGRQACLWTSRI